MVSSTTISSELQKPVTISPDELPRLCADDNYWFEQKLDGRRAILCPSTGLLYNKRKQLMYRLVTLPAPIISLTARGDFIDGELLPDGNFWAYDIVGSGTFEERRELLFSTLMVQSLPNINLVFQARGPIEKANMAITALKAGWEGLVVKKVSALYADKNASYKIKFKKSVDCIVIKTNHNGKNAIELGVWEDGALEPVNIGACSTYGKHFEVKLGDVVEVQYLYATGSRRLYQPVLIRKRDDKLASSCNIDQLEFWNERQVG